MFNCKFLSVIFELLGFTVNYAVREFANYFEAENAKLRTLTILSKKNRSISEANPEFFGRIVSSFFILLHFSCGFILWVHVYLACENSRPCSLPARVASRKTPLEPGA